MLVSTHRRCTNAYFHVYICLHQMKKAGGRRKTEGDEIKHEENDVASLG